MLEGHASPTRTDAAFLPAIVVPTYNNDRTLLGVLQALEAQGVALIVVNDGSTDDTADVLLAWVRPATADPEGGADPEAGGTAAMRVLTHPTNRGKAAALATGFAAALEAGFTHALTFDSDGQLNPAEVARVLEVSEANPASLVVGLRDASAEDYPNKSKVGRRFSNAAVKLECGLWVGDSQCGLRVYPLGLVSAVDCGFGRYAFETEVLTRSVWAGAGIVECPVTCRYDMPEGRVSHIRPWRDTLHGVALHARLLLRALLPIPHAHDWHDPNGREKRERDPRPWWRRALHWLNPLAAWRGIRAGELRRDELAAGLAVGVFIGNMPVYGLHTVICIYTAARLHLNPHLVVVGSSIFATPPLGLVLIALSVATGHLLLHGTLISPAQLDVAGLSWAQMAGQFLLEWAVGSLVVGVVLALASGVVGYALFGLLQRRAVARAARGEAALPAPADQPESL